MEQEKKRHLNQIANEIRQNIIRTIGKVGVGHVGGSLSMAELLAVLYYDVMRVDPENPGMEGRDRLILSKGHAGPALYAVLAMKGYFPMEWLDTMNRPGTDLPSHCDMLKTPGVDMTAGSLGQGFPCAVGIAKAARLMDSGEFIYAILGDGESQEGSVWEASMAAAQYGLDNLIGILDYNKLQLDGPVNEVMSLLDPVEKWKSFGFRTYEIDGHDVEAIEETVRSAQREMDGRPAMIVMHTIKGRGISFIEAAGAANHSMPLGAAEVERALEELRTKEA